MKSKEEIIELLQFVWNGGYQCVPSQFEFIAKRFLNSRISEQSDETPTIKENEQKEKLCRDADNCIAIKSRCCYEYHNHRNKCFKA